MDGGSSWEGQDGFGEDFGQKVDLTQRIREVLANYPEGTTILKELIQNADDAGARKVRNPSPVRLIIYFLQMGHERLLTGIWDNRSVFNEQDPGAEKEAL